MTPLSPTALATWTRRAMALLTWLLCVMPGVEAFAHGSQALMESLWSASGFCLDTQTESARGIELMTPDARAYQMSIELRALREMLANAPAPSPCSDETNDPSEEALCAPSPGEAQLEPALDLPQQPVFVAASLQEDIAPLPPVELPRSSCSASSSGPDRCEAHPTPSHRLVLDASFGSALLPPSLSAPRAPTPRAITLPLIAALPRRLLSPAEGHPLTPEQPPRHA